MPNLSDLFSAGGFLKWDGAGNADADYSSQTPAQLAADAAFTGAFAPLPTEMFVPAFAFTPSAGSAAITHTNSAGAAWAMDSAATEGVCTMTRVPSTWATVDIAILWEITSSSGDVVWRADIGNTADGETVQTDVAGTMRTITAGATGKLKVTTLETGKTVTPGSYVNLQILRVGNSGADTHAADAFLFGVMLTKAS